jgi:hypothetical protein
MSILLRIIGIVVQLLSILSICYVGMSYIIDIPMEMLVSIVSPMLNVIVVLCVISFLMIMVIKIKERKFI